MTTSHAAERSNPMAASPTPSSSAPDRTADRGDRAGAGRTQGHGVRGERRIGGGVRSAELTLPASSTTSARPSIRSRSRRRSGGRFRSRATASNGSSRRRMLAHPFDDGRARSRGTSLDATVARSRARRRRVSADDRDGRPRLAAARSARCSGRRGCRAIRSRWRGSALHALRSAEALAARRSRTTAPGRCLPASPRTACCRSIAC